MYHGSGAAVGDDAYNTILKHKGVSVFVRFDPNYKYDPEKEDLENGP